MAKYHRSINDEKVICNATKQSCPKDHVEAGSPEEADRLFEEMNKEQAGGTFNKVTREDEDTTEIIEVEDGDSVIISDYNDAHMWDTIEVINQDGEYAVEASVTDDMHRIVPSTVQDRANMMYGEGSDEAREYVQTYLDNRMPMVEKELQKRYPDIEMDHGSDINRFTFHHRLGENPPTEKQAVDAVYEKTSTVDFLNEMDPGTFGSENVSRSLQEQLEEYDSQKLPNPEKMEAKQQQKFVQDFVSSAEQDARMTYEEEYFMEHGEDPEQEIELSTEAKKHLTTQAAKFYKENEGDLNAWRETRGGNSIGGHDAYMVAAEHGVGYTDNYKADDPDSVIVSKRLAESAESEFRLGETEVGDDGQIHFLR